MDENFELARDIFSAIYSNNIPDMQNACKLLALLCQRLVDNGTINRETLDTMMSEALE